MFLSPSSNVTNDMTLSCTASATDLDEAVTAVFSWSVNGGSVGSGSSLDLSNVSVDLTDTVGCQATVIDSSGGTASGNASVSVVNRAPQLSTVSLSDSTPEARIP